MAEKIVELCSNACIRRHPGNPILTASDVPYDATLIFNAGVAKWQGRYVMVFRDDFKNEDDDQFEPQNTSLGLAWSDDGIRWEVDPLPCWKLTTDEIRRLYDPRLTVIDGIMHICFAMDTSHGIRGGIAVTDDFKDFDIISLSAPDNRNMVLFPEKINGQYVRLERPMPIYGRSGRDRFDIWLSVSPDLVHWGETRLVLGVEDVPFANDKIGPAAPPVLTEQGWLATFHAVECDNDRGKNGWEDRWQKSYCAGIMLLDRSQPWRVVGHCRTPLLAPEAPYETDGGYRNDVIFPGGMILEGDGQVKLYYGAADTVECLATCRVDDLLAICAQADTNP